MNLRQQYPDIKWGLILNPYQLYILYDSILRKVHVYKKVVFSSFGMLSFITMLLKMEVFISAIQFTNKLSNIQKVVITETVEI